MGQLVDGVWQVEQQLLRTDDGGRLRRPKAAIRDWVTRDGSAGPSGEGGFPAEPGRYHLYIARACPWAHRAAIMRSLKGLDDIVGLSVTHWHMGEQGWTFEPGPGVVPDPVRGARYLHEVYTASDPRYSGRVTTPVLWDRTRERIVSNESSEIMLMFDAAFDGVGARPGTYYPAASRPAIDAINERVYESLNNGVYKAGFAGSQTAYDEAVVQVFATLDWLEGLLTHNRYLASATPSVADWRLFATLVRFDSVYHGHFKCNRQRIVDYPALWAYTRDLYQVPGIAETVDLAHITAHYYGSHHQVNPSGIVPIGPVLDLDAPHGRERLR